MAHNWRTFVLGILAGIPVWALLGRFLEFVLHGAREQQERTRSAARELTEAAWEFQQATWAFFAAYAQEVIIRGARDAATEDEALLRRFEPPLAVFRRDYDLPPTLAEHIGSDFKELNIAFLNLSVARHGPVAELEQASKEIQTICEHIREKARPYTLTASHRIKRRLRQLF